MKNVLVLSLLIVFLIGGTVKTNASLPDSSTVKNNNLFALELFNKLAYEKENMFFSPFSISTAMAMTYAGAKGNTKREISKVMHFDSNQNNLNKRFSMILKYFNNLNTPGSFSIYSANSLWSQNGYFFSKAYINTIKKCYYAAIQTLDFKKDAENSRKIINKWVEQKTFNKITDLLKPNILNELTRLVLVNAIYFYGSWDKKFDEAQTKQMEFYIEKDKVVKASFMFSNDKYDYLENDKVQLIEIPYAGKKASMMIMLPKNPDNFNSLINLFKGDNYNRILGKLSQQKVKIYLPKFSITSEFDLNETLKKMGILEAFSMNADFSGMTGKKDLMIDKVIHKAFIDVSEKGTEAAAATAVVIREKTAPAKEIIFKADHPFFFLIKETKTGQILFAGKVYNPAVKGED
jgi:serpin B